VRANVKVLETHHENSSCGEHLVPARIGARVVVGAVELDGKPRTWTVEVDDNGPKRVLPPNWNSQLRIAQKLPHGFFFWCGFPAKLPRALEHVL
jgi:hypothetical protein